MAKTLGEHRSTHRVSRSSRSALFTASILMPVLALFAITQRSIPLLALAAVLLLLVAIMAGISEWAAGMGAVVELYEEAIVIRRSWTENAIVFFDDVDALFYDLASKRGPIMTMVTHDGRRFSIPRGLKDMPSLATHLDRKVSRPLVAPAKRALGDGETLHFGPIAVDAQCIQIQGDAIPWTDIATVLAIPEDLTFRLTDKRTMRVPLKDIPHPRVLLDVLALRLPLERSVFS